jgi:hypothetical protein
VFKYKIPSGQWRFFFRVDIETGCVDVIWAGTHAEADRQE